MGVKDVGVHDIAVGTRRDFHGVGMHSWACMHDVGVPGVGMQPLLTVDV